MKKNISQSSKKIVLILVICTLLAGAVVSYLVYRDWRQSFIQEPVVGEDGSFLSDSSNFWLDRSIPLPSL